MDGQWRNTRPESERFVASFVGERSGQAGHMRSEGATTFQWIARIRRRLDAQYRDHHYD